MDTHVNVIAILWIISGIFGLFLAVGLFLILIGVSYIPDMGHEAPVILRLVAIWGSIFIAAFAAPEIIGGIGLMKKKEWGRILVLVVSFLNLIWFPFWTALGVYSIVVLLKEETVQLFRT
ncbi:MAG: hypothetical protein JSV96_02620 [Candidatus Aminicenantes bacterium]|nr:MAG: hypothetical protein JSV96_02620 [Candidatus Aminicenantes bacterium]